MAGLVAIGPVAISHGDPGFASSASPVGHGIVSRTITGSCSWAAANELLMLVNNPAARVTNAGRTGVQEWLDFDADSLIGSYSGYYLLESFSVTARQQDSLTATDVPFTLSAAYLGDLA